MRQNSVVLDKTHALIPLPLLTVLVNTTASVTKAKIQTDLTHNYITVPPMKTKTITASVDHPSE